MGAEWGMEGDVHFTLCTFQVLRDFFVHENVLFIQINLK